MEGAITEGAEVATEAAEVITEVAEVTVEAIMEAEVTEAMEVGDVGHHRPTIEVEEAVEGVTTDLDQDHILHVSSIYEYVFKLDENRG